MLSVLRDIRYLNTVNSLERVNSFGRVIDIEIRPSCNMQTRQGDFPICWFNVVIIGFLNGSFIPNYLMQKIITIVLDNPIGYLSYLNLDACYMYTNERVIYNLFYTAFCYGHLKININNIRKQLDIHGLSKFLPQLGGRPFKTLYKLCSLTGLSYKDIYYGSKISETLNTDLVIVKSRYRFTFNLKELPVIPNYELDHCVFRTREGILYSHFRTGIFCQGKYKVLDGFGKTQDYNWNNNVNCAYLVYSKKFEMSGKSVLFIQLLKLNYGIYFVKLLEMYYQNYNTNFHKTINPITLDNVNGIKFTTTIAHPVPLLRDELEFVNENKTKIMVLLFNG
jgi:hypothetical protein